MRQVWTRACRPRSFLVVAALFVITLAVSSPIYSAASGRHLIGHTASSPVSAAAQADCSLATALQVAKPLFVWGNDVSKPITQVLCGPFTGPGSEAMAVTLTAPTCWPIQNWAVFRFTAGAWQLVLETPAYLVPPLVAVGSDIRETTAVHRAGDSRCFPSGGSHARIWHWDGTRFMTGPWKQVTKAEPKARGFYSPSKNIYCGMSDNSSFRSVDCYSYIPPQKATMNAAGRVTICRDRGTRNRCNIGNPGEGTPTLGYRRLIAVGRFRCLSRRSGVRCTVIPSGRGFLINRSGVKRVV
jgi:hypothetical protein